MTTATDTQPVYSSFGADPELGELVELFVSEMPERIAAVLDRHEQHDWEQLRRLAHQLKGAAGSYGFDQVTPFAAALENSARNQATEEKIRESVEQLVELCRRLRAGTPG